MTHYLEISGQRYEIYDVSFSEEVQSISYTTGTGQKITNIPSSLHITGSFKTDQNISVPQTITPETGRVRCHNDSLTEGKDYILDGVIIERKQFAGPNKTTTVDFIAKSSTVGRRYSKLTETFK